MTNGQTICTNCIMDTTDPDITFNEEGVCNHCQAYDDLIRRMPNTDAEKKICLDSIVNNIKSMGKGREYDCVIGVSGGVDSTYVAYVAKNLGLRPLAVHFDNGWNSELAVNNIENIINTLKIDLFTFVVDWEEMRDLQLAFFKASLANCDIPSDQAITAVLFQVAAKHGIKYILNGSNEATESILPRSWGYNSIDLRHLNAVQKKFGTKKLVNYPRLGFFKYYIYYRYLNKIPVINILNYLPYDKNKAKRVIEKELRWRDYGGKHYESVFTRFFQAYYLPTKFGFDKRKAHLSSLIVSGHLTRDAALEEIEKDPYPKDKLNDDKLFVAKKLGLSVEEFDAVIAQENKTFKDYPSYHWLFTLKDAFVKAMRK
jgi:N-acetyl sugar amidotransferase